MPVYEYYCPTCKHKFDLRRSISEMDAPAVCSEGHADTWRTLSMFSTIVNRGFGTYGDGPDFDFSPSEGGGSCACGGSCSCGG